MYNNQPLLTHEISHGLPLAFCEDALRKTSWAYVIWLIMAGIMSFVIYSLTRGSPIGSVRPALLIYYLIAGVHIMFRLKIGGKTNILCPDMLVLVFYTMFHLGYIMLYDFGFVPYSNPPFIFADSIPKSMFIINLGLVSFLLGYEILGGRSNAQNTTGHQTGIPGESWCYFGLACMIIAVIIHLSVLSLIAPHFQRYGYRALQRLDEYVDNFLVVLFWRYSTHLMSFGFAVYIVSSALRHGKTFKSKLALIVVIVYLVLFMMEGERGSMVKLLIPFLLVRHYFIKPVKIYHLVGIAVVGLILFTGMALVRTMVFQPQKMLAEYKYQKSAGHTTWMRLPIEAGHSYQTLNITAREVPSSEPYWHGASWRDAIIHIVPFLQGFAIRHGVSTWAPSTWVTTTYFGKERSGRGFTATAEGYLNFGYIGVIIELMFLGAFLRWITIRFSRNPSAMRGIIMLGGIGLTLLIVRGHITLLFAPFVQIVVVASLLNLFLGNEPSNEYETEEDTMVSDGDISYIPY